MELKNYNNIDKFSDKRIKTVGDVLLNANLKNQQKVKDNSNYVWYIKEQKYLKEKIYYNKTIEDVFKELQHNNVQEITRIIYYDNCCFLQYKRCF